MYQTQLRDLNVLTGNGDSPDFLTHSDMLAHVICSYLCKRCAAEKVAEGINAASCTFENGVVLPDGTSGVLFPWQI